MAIFKNEYITTKETQIILHDICYIEKYAYLPSLNDGRVERIKYYPSAGDPFTEILTSNMIKFLSYIKCIKKTRII